MSLPPGVETVTLTDGGVPVTGPDGTVLDGYLTLTGPDLATVREDGLIFGGSARRPVVGGRFDPLVVVANDANGLDPTGGAYALTFTPRRGNEWTRYIALLKAAPTARLVDVLLPDPVAATYATLVDPAGLLAASANLSDVDDPAAARTSLGLGGAATRDVGTTPDTVAAGDAASMAVAALSALTQTPVKTADEPRTATTILADDQHLFAVLDADSVYRFRAALLFDGPEAGDATLTFTVPSGASGGWAPFAGTLGTTVPDGSAQIKVAARQFGSPSDVGVMASSATLAGIMLQPQGVVITGPTPGLLRLRWAQQTANASPTVLKAGSSLEVVKLSGPAPSASGINLDFPGNYPSDQNLLAWTGDPADAGHVTAQSAGGVAGRITLTKIILRKQITWSAVWLGLAGVDTSAALTNCFLGVYDAAGVLRGSTADVSAVFTNPANAKPISLPLNAPFTAAPGAYFIAMLLNGTWATNVLTFKSTGAGISVNANLAAPNLRYSNMLSGQSSLPAALDLTQQTTSLINTGWASQWYGVS